MSELGHSRRFVDVGKRRSLDRPIELATIIASASDRQSLLASALPCLGNFAKATVFFERQSLRRFAAAFGYPLCRSYASWSRDAKLCAHFLAARLTGLNSLRKFAKGAGASPAAEIPVKRSDKDANNRFALHRREMVLATAAAFFPL